MDTLNLKETSKRLKQLADDIEYFVGETEKDVWKGTKLDREKSELLENILIDFERHTKEIKEGIEEGTLKITRDGDGGEDEDQEKFLNNTLLCNKQQFRKYQELQENGKMNMLETQVKDILGITKNQHKDIIVRYEDYIELYGLKDEEKLGDYKLTKTDEGWGIE